LLGRSVQPSGRSRYPWLQASRPRTARVPCHPALGTPITWRRLLTATRARRASPAGSRLAYFIHQRQHTPWLGRRVLSGSPRTAEDGNQRARRANRRLEARQSSRVAFLPAGCNPADCETGRLDVEGFKSLATHQFGSAHDGHVPTTTHATARGKVWLICRTRNAESLVQIQPRRPKIDTAGAPALRKLRPSHCGVEQRLARQAHNLKVVGSSPTVRNQTCDAENGCSFRVVVTDQRAETNAGEIQHGPAFAPASSRAQSYSRSTR
jgi:hypothetical protein